MINKLLMWVSPPFFVMMTYFFVGNFIERDWTWMWFDLIGMGLWAWNFYFGWSGYKQDKLMREWQNSFKKGG